MKNTISNKISDLLQEEWITYNLFLDEFNISTLPEYYYKDGKVIEYEEVKNLYSMWLISRKKD